MGEAARLDFNDTGVRVTLIEPGMVDTPFFDDPPAIDARSRRTTSRAPCMFAVSQPPHVDVNEILDPPDGAADLDPERPILRRLGAGCRLSGVGRRLDRDHPPAPARAELHDARRLA